MSVTSNRRPDERLATFADAVRAPDDEKNSRNARTGQQAPYLCRFRLPARRGRDRVITDGSKSRYAPLRPFEAAYAAAETAQKQAMQALIAEVSSNPAAAGTSLPPRKMIAFQQWLAAPGGTFVPAAADSIFTPLHEKSKAEMRSAKQAVRACVERGADQCDVGPFLQALKPGFQKLAAAVASAWPDFLRQAKSAMAFYQRQLPDGIDATPFMVRQQLLAKRAEALHVVRQVADAWGAQCVETVHLVVAMGYDGLGHS